MGVVYRARDEKLQRDVALKFLGALPSGSSASHEQILAEARAISALNHPNICTVYEVGEAEGMPFIAMEFVEGQHFRAEITSHGNAARTSGAIRRSTCGCTQPCTQPGNHSPRSEICKRDCHADGAA